MEHVIVDPVAVRDIFDQAIGRSATDLPAFLDRACASNPALRQEVERLINAHRRHGTLFNTDPSDDGASPGKPMSLHAGATLGTYQIVAPLGAGGMGEVYRAHDSRLGRDVAIKVLPPEFTAHPERAARFAREARLLATLKSPHIGAIYGLEEVAGISALVLELVEGATLAERLARGPLPIPQALVLARQIAAALEAAHDRSIAHRDLKPANIVLEGAGQTTSASGDLRAKVLDFGLAKILAASLDGPSPPAGSDGASGEGRIIGTPAYMSPEQARGEPVDKRTDVWAFGCVLFEMLTGKRAFDGKSAAETLAGILEREPDWSSLPSITPASIRTLLRRCLQKNPDKRLHDIADARIELDEVGTLQPTPYEGAAADRRGREWLGWIVAGALAAGWGGVALRNGPGAQTIPAERLEFPLAPPRDSRFSGTSPEFAISPDGRYVVFAASSRTGSSLWLHSLGTLETRQLPATEGGRNPFWSPNSSTVGFFANDQLKTVQVHGGSPVTLCPAPGSSPGSIPHSGTWNNEGVIVFAQPEGLRRVSAAGGPVTAVTVAEGGINHVWPSFLPDGRHFLYLSCACGSKKASELFVGSLTSGASVSLGPFESQAIHAAQHLFFVRGGNLMAQPFDDGSLQLKGEPLHLGVQAGVNPAWDRGVFSVSATGRVVYRHTARALSQLTWVDRRGISMATTGNPAVINGMALSPDGRSLAISQLTQQPGAKSQFDIWVRDLITGTASRLTDDPAWDFGPTWSPDGKHIAFISNRPPISLRFNLYMRPWNGSGDDIVLVQSPLEGPQWGRNNIIVYYNIAGYHGVTGTDTGTDIWTLAMSGDRRPAIFLKTKHNERSATFSPDGRWIAYISNASGRDEVYVRSFPSKDPSFRVSRDGGTQPSWRGDGQELFFLSPDMTMMAARVTATDGFRADVPQPLFATSLARGKPYAVTPNGQRLLIPIDENEPLRVVLDWRGLLPR